jgi:hypothetical protein
MVTACRHRQMTTAALFCGISFAVSLFLSDLVFAESNQPLQNSLKTGEDPSLRVVTVATAETDGLRRLRHSAAAFDLLPSLRVLGAGQRWTGGDMSGAVCSCFFFVFCLFYANEAFFHDFFSTFYLNF